MAVDIGAEAIYRGAVFGGDRTFINRTGRATAGGVVTSIDIWAYSDITNFRVGTFYVTNGNTFKCRDSEAIPGTITGGEKVTKVVSLAVAIDDYIGCYIDHTDKLICRDSSGFAGVWYVAGEFIDVNDEATYTLIALNAISLGGYIGAVAAVGRSFGFIFG